MNMLDRDFGEKNNKTSPKPASPFMLLCKEE